ncbi:MAG TPA: hypothetical protein VGB16_01335 [candidate division Zixibacteria bacterium]
MTEHKKGDTTSTPTQIAKRTTDEKWNYPTKITTTCQDNYTKDDKNYS